MKIKLQDGYPLSSFYSIPLKVINLPPAFKGSVPQNQTVMINTVQKYTLPPYYDPEGCPIATTFEPSTLSSFVSIQGNQFIFAPTQLYQVGSTDITVTLTDSKGLNISKTFGLIVYLPPKFTKNVPKQLDLMLGQTINFTLPVDLSMLDERVVHISSLPPFVSFNSPEYTISPINPNDPGTYTIRGQLWNTYT